MAVSFQRALYCQLPYRLYVGSSFSSFNSNYQIYQNAELPFNFSFPVNSQGIHTSSSNNYMMTKYIPLPENIEDIDAAEKSQFSPQRSRDISGPVILSKTMGTFINNQFATSYNCRSQPSDPRLGIYDCRGPVSLHSAMQTNVPEPFSPKGKAMHLNMPGGQWGQGHKYISDDLQNFHYQNMARQSTSGTYITRQQFASLKLLQGQVQLQSRIFFSTSSNETPKCKKLTGKEKFKLLVRDYGSTVVVFHVTISLISLGGCYLLVASGINLDSILSSWNLGDTAKTGGSFVIAYAIHKVFAPVRLAITATASPFLVKFLRRKGILKQPKVPSTKD